MDRGCEWCGACYLGDDGRAICDEVGKYIDEIRFGECPEGIDDEDDNLSFEMDLYYVNPELETPPVYGEYW